MKSVFLLFSCLLSLSQHASAAWTNTSFSYGGQTRSFRTYVPASYNSANPATLIVVLHGLGGSMNDAANVGVTSIADTANIILLSPQALDFNSPLGVVQAAWNCGIKIDIPGFGLIAVNGNVDDVGFIKAMIDSTTADYSINMARIYACGASMGGFMTQRLACEASDRFAAVASVMGTYALALPPCNPGKMMPVAHFHGTSDEVVSWNGELLLGTSAFPVGLSVDTLIAKWVNLDGCSATPQHDTWPDSNNDNIYVEHFSYFDAANVSRVELFKVNGGTHYWYQSQDTDGEIDYATEIWKFFNKQYGSTTGVDEKARAGVQVRLYPNPAGGWLQISSSEKLADIQIIDLYGRTVLMEQRRSASGLDISHLNPGIYLAKCSTAKGAAVSLKFVKQ
jgi:polyhydroxybutyrate depolymerase